MVWNSAVLNTPRKRDGRKVVLWDAVFGVESNDHDTIYGSCVADKRQYS